MKLACSSTAFDRLIRSGDLTQLEWVDLCARELAADGVVLDVRHFPRTDTDYLAQIKKMAADLGMTVAAVRHDGFFAGDAARMEQAVEIALATGAPLVSAPLQPETETGWSEALARIGAATAIAKRHNITLALRNLPHTFAAGTHDMKRVSKEADSAWLRYGPEPAAFGAAGEPASLLAKTVLVWHAIASSASEEIEPLLALLPEYRGFLALDAAEGDATAEGTKNALRSWRSALCVADRA